MHNKILLELVNWSSLPVLLLLIPLLLKRRILRRFPLFFSYINAAFFIDIIRLLTYWSSSRIHLHPYRIYFYTYWITDILLTLTTLAAICELFLNVLFARFHTIKFYRYLFLFIAIILTVLTIAISLQRSAIQFKFIEIDHALDSLRVAVLLFFVALMLFIGRHWCRYEIGIASGFAIDASAFLATFAIWKKIPFMATYADELPAIAFD